MPARQAPPPPDKYDEAIRFFRRKIPMTDPEFRELEAAELDRAFWVAGVTQGRVVQELMDAIDRAIVDGTTLEDFKADAGVRLAEAWGGDDPVRLETVFRTNVMGAYNAARTEVFSDPDVMEARPYLRFDSADDSRVTEDICEPLDGVVLRADDPFWRTRTPPLHHNCRSVLTPLSKEEAGEEGITKSRPDAEPDEGFGTPAKPGEGEPDLSGFDPDIRRALERRFK